MPQTSAEKRIGLHSKIRLTALKLKRRIGEKPGNTYFGFTGKKYI